MIAKILAVILCLVLAGCTTLTLTKVHPVTDTGDTTDHYCNFYKRGKEKRQHDTFIGIKATLEF